MRTPKYTNEKVPEGISSGHEHPLAEAAKSSAMVFAIFAVVVVGSYMAALFAAPYLPFSWEIALAQEMNKEDAEFAATDSPTQAYLAALGARVAEASDLPADMAITVRYVEEDTVNAYATLGGNIVVYDGLWRLLDSENTAVMLLAHEIAHVKNRDPIRSASGALLASLSVGILLGDVSLIDDLVDMGSFLTAMHFSREMEIQADNDALKAVIALYGHLNGATDLFERLKAFKPKELKLLAFMDSHPLLEERLANLRRQAEDHGWSSQGKKTALP